MVHSEQNPKQEWLERTLFFGITFFGCLIASKWHDDSLSMSAFVEKSIVAILATVVFGFLTRKDRLRKKNSTENDAEPNPPKTNGKGE